MATRKCPHCAEKIQARASVCKHCHAAVTPKSGFGCISFIFGNFLLVFVALVAAAIRGKDDSSATAATENDGAPPTHAISPSGDDPKAKCRDWFAEHGQYGKVQTVVDLPDYFCGPRRKVVTSLDDYDCYLKDGNVASIRLRGAVLFRAPNTECSALTTVNETRPKTDIPAYKVVDKMKKLAGGFDMNVIVEALKPTTSQDELDRIGGEIARREDATGSNDKVYIFCSEEALKADMSATFRKAHPKAGKCALGVFKNGAFHRL